MKEQTAEALARAQEVRLGAVAYKRRITDGEISLAEAIRTCDQPVSVQHLLTAKPRIGPVGAARIIAAANLRSPHLRFGGSKYSSAARTITQDERERLLDVVENGANYRRPSGELTKTQRVFLRERMRRYGISESTINGVLA